LGKLRLSELSEIKKLLIEKPKDTQAKDFDDLLHKFKSRIHSDKSILITGHNNDVL